MPGAWILNGIIFLCLVIASKTDTSGEDIRRNHRVERVEPPKAVACT